MNDNQHAAFNRPGQIPFTAPTVGLLKQLVALVTGESVDDLAVVDTLGEVVYELPDYVKPPVDPYIFLKPRR